ncbi:MAG: transcriptional regulator [Thermotogaceae bacterium]|nr:transcriptional regulator [Thermotogaceae bacterium]RKX57379.1 MAG: transcriptional regulator [Thermotoga sp.]
MQLNFNPVGREEIHKLETALLVGTLFRPEVIEEIRNSSERLTWVDSLAVSAGALARSKAGMTVSEIAEELGRTETTIREHLKGESKAGKLVIETYELLKEGKLRIDELFLESEREKLRERLIKLKEEIEDILKSL